jgi:hypothetical protein
VAAVPVVAQVVIPAKAVPLILALHRVVVVVAVVLATLVEAAVEVVALAFLALAHQEPPLQHFKVPVDLVDRAEIMVTPPPSEVVLPEVLPAVAEGVLAQTFRVAQQVSVALALAAQFGLFGLLLAFVALHHSLLQT